MDITAAKERERERERERRWGWTVALKGETLPPRAMSITSAAVISLKSTSSD